MGKWLGEDMSRPCTSKIREHTEHRQPDMSSLASATLVVFVNFYYSLTQEPLCGEKPL